MMAAMNGVLVEIPPPVAAVTTAVVLVAASLLVLRWRGGLTARRLLVLGTTSLYLAGVAAVTLPLQIRTGDYGNRVPWYDKVNLIPLITIDARTFVLNVLMTVPLGLLLPLLIRVDSVRRVALIGFVLSAAVEVTQFLSDVFVSSGRTGDVNDLPANTLGAVLGYLAYRLLTVIPAVAGLATRWGPPSPAARVERPSLPVRG
jgi:VanZ like protein